MTEQGIPSKSDSSSFGIQLRPLVRKKASENNLFVRLSPRTVVRLHDAAVASSMGQTRRSRNNSSNHSPEGGPRRWSILAEGATQVPSTTRCAATGIEFLPLKITTSSDGGGGKEETVYASYNGGDLKVVGTEQITRIAQSLEEGA